MTYLYWVRCANNVYNCLHPFIGSMSCLYTKSNLSIGGADVFNFKLNQMDYTNLVSKPDLIDCKTTADDEDLWTPVCRQNFIPLVQVCFNYLIFCVQR